MNNLFHSTTLRLTAWYTLILLVISLLFSTVVFQISAAELRRGFGLDAQNNALYFVDNDTVRTWRDAHIREGVSHLVGQLVIFNIFVLAAGAAGGYLLARRTLRPIEDAMNAQIRFSSDAAHELRTPLTIMQSEIEVGLRNTNATKANYSSLLKSNLDEVDHMRTLTDRLLMLANQNDLTIEPTSLESVAIEAVNRSIPLAQNKHISVENEIGQLQVQGNASSLTDVLFILIDNAIKYSPDKSTVTLRAEAKGRMAEITVLDNGSGIAPDDLPHIFDRFYRADASRSSQNTAGHGLGLSIAQRIVKVHGGNITATNNPKKGATFTIALPLA
jgi:signal transduction histidine kinase